MTNRTVLLVDTSASALKQARVALEFEGIDVIQASDVKQARESVRSRLPALVICGVALPDGSGYELCRSLGGDELTANVKVILTHSSMDVYDESRARRCGAAAGLARPYLPSQVLARVRDVMGSAFLTSSLDHILDEDDAPDSIPATERFLSTAESAFLEDTADEPAALASDLFHAIEEILGDAGITLGDGMPTDNVELLDDTGENDPEVARPRRKLDSGDLEHLVERAVRNYLDRHLPDLVAKRVDEALRNRKG